MNAVRFVAGQLVRIDAPGNIGHRRRGMVSVVGSQNYEVVFPVNQGHMVTQEYHQDRLTALEPTPAGNTIPGGDAAHRAEAEAILGNAPRSSSMPRADQIDIENPWERTGADQLAGLSPNPRSWRPDPRITVAQALAVELFRAQIEPTATGEYRAEKVRALSTLAAIGAKEIIRQLNDSTTG